MATNGYPQIPNITRLHYNNKAMILSNTGSTITTTTAAVSTCLFHYNRHLTLLSSHRHFKNFISNKNWATTDRWKSKTLQSSYLPPIIVEVLGQAAHGAFLLQMYGRKMTPLPPMATKFKEILPNLQSVIDVTNSRKQLVCMAASLSGSVAFLASGQVASASEYVKLDPVYEVGELFELGIQLSYLLLLLGLLGAGTFFVIRQVLVRRELDLSAKELQEQVRSGDAGATELFELGAVMLRRKFYSAAIKYLLQAIEKWDGDDQDLAQVYNALGVSYIREGKTDKGIAQLEKAVRIQPGYVTAWNNLGDAYEKKKELKSALKAFEEVLLFDPNNTLARPRRDALKEKVEMYRGVPIKSKER